EILGQRIEPFADARLDERPSGLQLGLDSARGRRTRARSGPDIRGCVGADHAGAPSVTAGSDGAGSDGAGILASGSGAAASRSPREPNRSTPRSTRAACPAASPLRTAPSIVAGHPVSVHAPARKTPFHAER